MKKLLIIGAVSAALLLAQAAHLALDPSHADVEFVLPSLLHTVHGTFQLQRGSLEFDPESEAVTGELVVDARSGDSGGAARDRRMHKEILESDKYPLIVFRPDRMEGKVAPQGASNVQLHGVFSIHGGDHEMTVPVEVHAEGGQYTSTAHFLVPYVKWGMKNPSTLMLRVNDKVEITVHAAFRPVHSTA